MFYIINLSDPLTLTKNELKTFIPFLFVRILRVIIMIYFTKLYCQNCWFLMMRKLDALRHTRQYPSRNFYLILGMMAYLLIGSFFYWIVLDVLRILMYLFSDT